ncbi:cadherin repeat domain-containing protein [Halosquirtibacter xylanolyticus]|uniref:cadherin repeat domain-containing protein n=1 Tax=Halosquirtibacter xylanolyticus TaxID=3374599 RepID=UPI003748BD1F|nr:cadherin repeat domain-containing protein [Prolixibacteraceae bacterium]
MCLNLMRLQTLRTFVFMSFLLSLFVYSCTPDTYQYNDKTNKDPYGLTYSGVGDVFEGNGFETSKAYLNTEVGQSVKYYFSSFTSGETDLGAPDYIVVDSINGSIILKGTNDLLPGDYSIGIMVKNFRNDLTMELQDDGKTIVTPNPVELAQTVFKDGFTFQILTNGVSNLDYIQKVQKAKPGKAFSSTTPKIEGSNPITYSLAAGTPSEFAIDKNTGVISLADGNKLAQNNYLLSVIATNEAGAVTFENVVTVTVAPAVDLELINSNFTPYNEVSYGKEKNDLGNMISFSVDEPTSTVMPFQSSNHRWTHGWGIWNQKVGSKKESFAIMIPNRSVQEDYLLFDYNVKLVDSENSRVILKYTHNWGVFEGLRFELVVTDNYTGDPSTTVWNAYPLVFDPVRLKMTTSEVMIPEFEGKAKVRIGVRSVFTVPAGKDVTVLTKNILVESVQVRAKQ